MVGLPAHEFQQFLAAPYLSLPRFDAGVHLRAQTKTLEDKAVKNHTQFALDMHHYHKIFQAFERTLSHRFFVQSPVLFNVTSAALTGAWPRIFISCDDVDVRDAFVRGLLNRSDSMGRFLPVFVNASSIKHIKHISFDDTTPDQGLVDTAFDWYALSLARVIFAWRTGFSSVVSTFMQSATSVSMVKPTNKDFKATILRKDYKFKPDFEFVDNIQEIEEEEKRAKAKKKGKK